MIILSSLPQPTHDFPLNECEFGPSSVTYSTSVEAEKEECVTDPSSMTSLYVPQPSKGVTTPYSVTAQSNVTM